MEAKENMKVCIVRNAEGRMNAQMRRVATALLQQNHDVFYVTRKRDGKGNSKFRRIEELIDGNIILNYEVTIPAELGKGQKNVHNVLKYQQILYKWFKEHLDMFDAIHAIDLDTGIIANKVCKKYNKHLIYHIADFYSESRMGLPNLAKKVLKKMEFNVINHADATIICTDKRVEQIAGSRPKNLTIVHNTPAVKRKTKKSTIINNKEVINITYVGGLEKKRFIDQAVKVIAAKEFCFFTVAGTPGNAAEEVKKYSEFNNISYKGTISYEEALKLYEETDIIIAVYDPTHPNHRYSAPNKIYEAMFLGKAVIVAKNSGMDEIVKAYDMGYIIDYEECELDSILDQINKNREELYKKKLNAYEAYNNFSWEEMQSRINSLYEKISN